MRFFLPLIAFVAPLVAGMAFTDPDTNATITKGSYYNLTWTSVDTDATTFGIYLVNFVNWPPSYTLVASDVQTAAGKTSVRVPCDVDSSYGYQFNAVNASLNLYVIYAQTPKFFISGADCTDPTTNASTCAAAATVTVTVSKSSANATATANAEAKSTSYGTVPNTIGWKSGYLNPVTLASVPTPGQPLITAAPIAELAAQPSYVATTTVWETVYADLEECGCAA